MRRVEGQLIGHAAMGKTGSCTLHTHTQRAGVCLPFTAGKDVQLAELSRALFLSLHLLGLPW